MQERIAEALPRLRGLKCVFSCFIDSYVSNCRGIAPLEGTEIPRRHVEEAYSVALQRHCPA